MQWIEWGVQVQMKIGNKKIILYKKKSEKSGFFFAYLPHGKTLLALLSINWDFNRF